MGKDFLTVTSKIIEKNMIGHAYLVQVGINYDRKYIIDFIKKIVNNFNVSLDEKKLIFDQIDTYTFSDIIYILPDGQDIKKEQIMNLQDEFKTKSAFNEKRFYIIEFAENLNKSAYNTLLKFLEEPDNDVVAFLVTKNIDFVANTIISRCQKLNLIKETTFLNNYDIEKINFACKYLNILLNKKKNAIPYLNEIYKLKSDQIIEIFQIWLEILYSKINKNFILNFENADLDVPNYDIKRIILFINMIDKTINMCGKNYNNRLLIDKLVINMFGVDCNV